jgi:Uma2 family endonuclease
MPKTLTRKLTRGSVTFDEFCFLVKDKQKADLIDGVIYMASPDNLDANDITAWLSGLLYDFVFERDLGKTWILRVAFRLDVKNAPEPDIGFVLKSRLHLAKRGYFDGHPDAAFEVVSPESVERDYIKKLRQYEEFGVREYWIIDEIEETVTLYRLNRKGKYQEVRAKDGVFRSEVIDGFRLDPKWLWQTPKPKKSTILAQLLQSAE